MMSADNYRNLSTETKHAKTVANRLAAYFPQPAASDTKVFAAGLVELLAHYPPEVLAEITQPYRGLPSKYKFMPSIAEVKEFCEATLADQRRHRQTVDRWSKPQLAAPAVDRSTRLSYDELKAKYGPNWGVGDPDVPNSETPEQARKKLIDEFGEEMFNAVPDAPLSAGMRPIGNLASNVSESSKS